MYKITLTTILAIGIMAFNQPNKDKSGNSKQNTEKNSSSNQKENKGKKTNKSDKKDKQVFEKKGNGNQKGVKQVNNNNNNNHNKGNHKTKHYKKDHPNFHYVYVNDHGYFSHKNFGQWRSEQARNKHKKYKPKYEYQAIEGFQLIKTRNVFLFQETDYKINLLNIRLAEKLKSNEINAVAYDSYVNRIEELQQRRAILNINISL